MKRLLLRLLALALLLIVVTAVAAIFVVPIWSAVSLERDRLEQNQKRIARQSTIEGRAAEYAALLDQTPQELVDQHIYRAKTIVSAETTFQKELSALVERSGATLNTINGLVARPASGFTQLALRLEATADAKQLAQLLQTLKDNDKIMVVSKATIRVRSQETDSGPAELGLSFEILAYARI